MHLIQEVEHFLRFTTHPSYLCGQSPLNFIFLEWVPMITVFSSGSFDGENEDHCQWVGEYSEVRRYISSKSY